MGLSIHIGKDILTNYSKGYDKDLSDFTDYNSYDEYCSKWFKEKCEGKLAWCGPYSLYNKCVKIIKQYWPTEIPYFSYHSDCEEGYTVEEVKTVSNILEQIKEKFVYNEEGFIVFDHEKAATLMDLAREPAPDQYYTQPVLSLISVFKDAADKGFEINYL